MKRKLFFLLERLEITRSERIAITTLLGCLVLTSGIYALAETTPNYDSAHYAELEAVFAERSQDKQQEYNSILARYEPELHEENLATAPSDTIPPDSLKENRAISSGKVNINQAGAVQLRTLPGIGPAYAKRIIEWREKNGPFTSKQQLLEIKGIGEKRLENMIARIEL